MATCNELIEKLTNEQTKLKDLDKTLAEMNTEKLWYEAIEAYWEKIEKAFLSPDAIKHSLDSGTPDTPNPDCLKTEALAVSKLADGFVTKINIYLQHVIQAHNETAAAAAALKMEEVKASIDSKDEDFKKSEINKTLEAIFKSIEEIQAKSAETLSAALNHLKVTFALKDFTSDNGRLIKQIIAMNKYADESKLSTDPTKDSYYKETEKEWKAAKDDKKEPDSIIADRNLAATLVDAYTAAKKAMNCSD
jgi:hypothetical protein